ncbi:MAG: hypothetical protein ACFFCH_06865 [Promethearchaeota archaeon]
MFAAETWFSCDAIPITDPLVIQFGNDAVIRNSAKKLVGEVNNAKLVYVDSLATLMLICRKAIGELFYVGHGSEQGLHIGEDLISWNDINSVIQRMPATEHYFAACFSANIGKVKDKLVLGFPSIIDADVASLLVSMTYYYIHEQFDMLMQLTQQLFTGFYLSKLLKPEKPLWYVEYTQISGWTPYGLYCPPAVYFLLNAIDISIIQNTGAFSAALITAIVAYCTGGIGVIIGPFLVGMATAMAVIAARDTQGVQPYTYVEIWIPQDAYNYVMMLTDHICFFRTTSFWWISCNFWCIPIGPV